MNKQAPLGKRRNCGNAQPKSSNNLLLSGHYPQSPASKLLPLFTLLALLFTDLSASAAGNDAAKNDLVDSLYTSGKIYVVVTILSIIFIGFIIYLIMLDRKVGKVEKMMEGRK